MPGCAGMASMVTTGDGLFIGWVWVDRRGTRGVRDRFISYMCLTLDSGPADAGSRAGAGDVFVSGSIDRKQGDLGTAAAARTCAATPACRWPALEYFPEKKPVFRKEIRPRSNRRRRTISHFVFKQPDAPSERSARSSFGARFAFDVASAVSAACYDPRKPNPSKPRGPSTTGSAARFRHRHRGSICRGCAIRGSPRARLRAPRLLKPRPSRPPRRPPDAWFQLASASDTSLPLGYAPTELVKGSAMGTSLKGLTPRIDPLGDTSRTAIYDITARRCICRTDGGWKQFRPRRATWTIYAM